MKFHKSIWYHKLGFRFLSKKQSKYPQTTYSLIFNTFIPINPRKTPLWHYIAVHEIQKCHMIHGKISNNPCKASHVNRRNSIWYHFHLLWCSIIVSHCSHITTLAWPCCPPLRHVVKMCGEYQPQWRFLCKHVVSQWATHMGVLLQESWI